MARMLRLIASTALLVLISVTAPATPQTRPPVQTPRLYVFDCGTLEIADTGRFRL